MKQDSMEKLIGKRVILFTKKSFRFEGEVISYDGRFLEIFDEIKKKSKLIHIDEVMEIEVKGT